MSRTELLAALFAVPIAITLTGWFVHSISEADSRYLENCRIHNEHRATLMGRPFQMNGKTYTGVQHSQWNDDIRCVSPDGSEQWVSLAVIENLLKAQAEKP